MLLALYTPFNIQFFSELKNTYQQRLLKLNPNNFDCQTIDHHLLLSKLLNRGHLWWVQENLYSWLNKRRSRLANLLLVEQNHVTLIFLIISLIIWHSKDQYTIHNSVFGAGWSSIKVRMEA